MNLLSTLYLALLGVGILAAVALVGLAFFWPAVEWRLLCWLDRRRRDREALGYRLAIRRPR